MIYLFCFFVHLLFFKNVPRLKFKKHNIQSWMLKQIFKVIKSCTRKMLKRTHLLGNSKMVKIFLERSNSNFGSNQLTSVVDMPCRIIIGKFQQLKQGFRFIIHTRIFKIATFQEWKWECIGEKSRFWIVLYYCKYYEMLIWL